MSKKGPCLHAINVDILEKQRNNLPSHLSNFKYLNVQSHFFPKNNNVLNRSKKNILFHSRFGFSIVIRDNP
jgi:hypothetical protein